MGVADNRTYKNEYHFTDDTKNTAKEHPSIEQDPKINSTIKKNPYRSNVEIEGDEIVLEPDLSALFKAKGKKHSGGGMDVLLKPDSFIFSDYKGLKISPKEHELFELKEGGTPAATLKKNVDPKHYNTLVNILDNPYKDDLAKKSAAKMLDKYIGTLGNIAYIQESKKGFPTGVPEFALGTAPVYDKDLKIEIDANKQYMKAGGKIGNPYLAAGGIGDLECPCGRDAKGNCLPCDDYSKVQSYIPKAKVVTSIPTGYNQIYSGPQGTMASQSIFNQTQRRKPTPQEEAAYMAWLNTKSPEEKQRIIQANITAGQKKTNPNDQFAWMPNSSGIAPFKPGPIDMSLINSTTPTVTSRGLNNIPDQLKVPQIDGNAQGSKVASWQFTPWQKASQLFNWGQYANVKRYMPFRSKYTATYVDPALVNPEQAVGDAKAVTNQQIGALNTLSPVLRNAQAAQAFGQLLNQIPAIRSQYDNQNAQIVNQSRMYNNQVKNNESMVNMGNDQQYYQQAIEGRKNFDNMRQFLANQAMNNTLRDVETNQKLAYSLLTQNNPAYNFNWKTGFLDRTNKSIMDAQGTDPKSDLYTELATTIMNKIRSGKNPTPEEVNFMKSLAVGKLNFSPSADNMFGSQKKGGKMRNPYKK